MTGNTCIALQYQLKLSYGKTKNKNKVGFGSTIHKVCNRWRFRYRTRFFDLIHFKEFWFPYADRKCAFLYCWIDKQLLLEQPLDIQRNGWEILNRSIH